MVQRIHINTLLDVMLLKDNDVIRPLCVRLPQITGYARKFDENATMSVRVNNKQLLKDHNQIWERVEKLLKEDFECKLFMVMTINT